MFLHDFTTGADRRLTNTAGPGSPSPEDQFAEEYSFSRDGKRLAYTWFDGKKDRYELRIVDLQGTGIPPYRRLFDNEDIFWIAPYDWSPDGTSIAVSLHRRDRSAQIGLVTVRDGSLRVLKSVDWRGPSKMLFSRDGKHLAYALPAKETGAQRDVFLMAIDGSREIPAVTHPANDALVGWSPDGRRLLFSSDRTGSAGLWDGVFKVDWLTGQVSMLAFRERSAAGVAWRDGRFTDMGAGQGHFKTPTLREIPRTAPYMHDGSLATIVDVIEYYDCGGNPSPGLDAEIRPLRLTAGEKQSLDAFLRSLNRANF